MTGAKTIAEYAIKKWLKNQELALEYFKLSMDGDRGILTDRNGETLVLQYHSDTKTVSLQES